jgi:hypothetical protein
MKIKLTEFALRHFNPKFGATKILNYTPEEFEEIVQFSIDSKGYGLFDSFKTEVLPIINGYAPFCKLLPITNFTDAKSGTIPLTLENIGIYQFIRSGYFTRTEDELPVFSRWVKLPFNRPNAEFLMLILYSKEQIDKESITKSLENKSYTHIPFEADYGIVSINGQSHPYEEPIKPETMIRNALGIKYGGSGVKINKKKYLESVQFWENNISIG